MHNYFRYAIVAALVFVMSAPMPADARITFGWQQELVDIVRTGVKTRRLCRDVYVYNWRRNNLHFTMSGLRGSYKSAFKWKARYARMNSFERRFQFVGACTRIVNKHVRMQSRHRGYQQPGYGWS